MIMGKGGALPQFNIQHSKFKILKKKGLDKHANEKSFINYFSGSNAPVRGSVLGERGDYL